MGIRFTTRDLAQEITKHSLVTRSEAEQVIAGLSKAVPAMLERGGFGTTVKVGTLGTFGTKKVNPRTIKMLGTGRTKTLPATIASSFKKGDSLKLSLIHI